MADVRSLLRSHQQSSSTTRITHPLASYNAAGALRCTACSIVVKPSAWEGHVVSKTHRKRAAVLKMDTAERKGKRKDIGDVEEEAGTTKKRRVSEDVEMDDSEPAVKANGGFPAGFFSDPSRAPPARESSPSPPADAEVDVPIAEPPPSTTIAAAAAVPTATPSALDLEWESFQKAVLEAPPPATTEDDSYTRATVFAEPELVVPTLPEGFPATLQPVIDAQQPAQVKRQPQRNVQTATGETPTDKEETVEEKRERKEREEKELIMDRILDEERAQEEADERVVALKNRLDAMKKMRRERAGKKGA